ncbi:unnamed protein product [Lactuca saligna]|uniref:Uncharacterized protein n=1 Tax=Lactuca saligna TaxID=75948 RepID=A0AA36E9T5_LACSI|nr:unnamed protein product [Lactuca saligna]
MLEKEPETPGPGTTYWLHGIHVVATQHHKPTIDYSQCQWEGTKQPKAQQRSHQLTHEQGQSGQSSWDTACIPKRSWNMILPSKMVKGKRKDAHTLGKKNECKPQARNPGEGCGSNNITMQDIPCTDNTDAKKRWIPLSTPMHLRKVKIHSTKKEPDNRQNPEITKARGKDREPPYKRRYG